MIFWQHHNIVKVAGSENHQWIHRHLLQIYDLLRRFPDPLKMGKVMGVVIMVVVHGL